MDAELAGRLRFLQAAEALKDVLRSGHTSQGRPESTAEHSWRLCLMALVFEDAFDGLDMKKVLSLCVIHDLAEAVVGDVPAVLQKDGDDKEAAERAGLRQLIAGLDPLLAGRIASLWEEYVQAETPEARAVKAMDKLETIMQHNQGLNAPGFDYGFNLDYGRKHTDAVPALAALRALLDQGTRARMGAQP
jgi:putative hydrolase of HD superfamily